MKMNERNVNIIGYIAIISCLLGTNPITTIFYSDYILWFMLPIFPFMFLCLLNISGRLNNTETKAKKQKPIKEKR